VTASRNSWKNLSQTTICFGWRFLYAYPNRVTQKVLDTIAAHPRLAKSMDMPLQHASRTWLARMKRVRTADAFFEIAGAHSMTVPGVSLRTFVSRGLPRPVNRRRFLGALAIVRTANLDWMGVFRLCSDVDKRGSYALDESGRGDDQRSRNRLNWPFRRNLARELWHRIFARKAARVRRGPHFHAGAGRRPFERHLASGKLGSNAWLRRCDGRIVFRRGLSTIA